MHERNMETHQGLYTVLMKNAHTSHFISPFIKALSAFDPCHEKTCSCHMRTTKAQISLRIRAVHSRYVDFAYLNTTTYVEVIFHSQHFFSIFLCISTPSMSKTVNMKQRVSQGDFSCPRRIFYYICYCLCRSIKSALAWAPYCLLQLYTCIS